VAPQPVIDGFDELHGVRAAGRLAEIAVPLKQRRRGACRPMIRGAACARCACFAKTV